MPAIEIEQDIAEVVVRVFGQHVSTFEKDQFGSAGLDVIKQEIEKILCIAAPHLLRSGDSGTATFLPLVHQPMWGPRKGHVGEAVFLACWQAWLTEETEMEEFLTPADYRLACVMRNYPFPLHQRQATVAASLMTWFGTNLGGAFLDSARRLINKGIAKAEAYLMAWSVANKRLLYVNQGIRVLENCLAPSDVASRMPANRIMDLSILDNEAAECLMAWLGTDEGQGFLERAEACLDYYRAVDSCRFYLEHSFGLTAAGVRDACLIVETAMATDTPMDSAALVALGLPVGGPQNVLCSLVKSYRTKTCYLLDSFPHADKALAGSLPGGAA